MIRANSTGALTRGFAPIAGRDARLLILGSLPSAASVAAGEYYAHPRNAFWPIMQALFGAAGNYAGRTATLIARRVAVWDVLQASVRPGSLDANIDAATAVPNDFQEFFATHLDLQLLVCNGKMAERLFRQRVLSHLQYACPPLQVLPSTSPAHAAMSVAAKTAAWRNILKPYSEGD